MKIAKSVLVASALALASGVAFAGGDAKHEKGFNAMDKNGDGFLTKAEAASNKDLLAKWKEADKNNDGKLSRTEYLTVMAKEDVGTAKEKVSKAPKAAKEEVSEAKRRSPVGGDSAATGSTTESGKPK